MWGHQRHGKGVAHPPGGSASPLPPSNPDTGVHPLPLNLQVSCSSRLRLSQSQREKTEEVPRTPPPPPAAAHPPAHRPSEESPLGWWGWKKGPLKSQLRPLHPSLLCPLLCLLPPRSLDGLSEPREGSGPRPQAGCHICALPGLFSFPLSLSRKAKPGKNLKILPSPAHLSFGVVINPRPRIRGQ